MNDIKNEKSHIYRQVEIFLKSPDQFSIDESRNIIRNAILALSTLCKEEINLNCTKKELITLARKIVVLLKEQDR